MSQCRDAPHTYIYIYMYISIYIYIYLYIYNLDFLVFPRESATPFQNFETGGLSPWSLQRQMAMGQNPNRSPK